MDGNSSARLGLPYLAAAQLQKHVTLNEALTRLDALVQTTVVSRTVAAQPAIPADGDLYILPADTTGAAWAARGVGDLMRAEAGGWALVPVVDGVMAWVIDEAQIVVRRDGVWSPLGEALGALQNVALLGLGATADAANPFSARLNTALWTARETGDGGDGDLRLTFNKQTPGDVLSLLFQSGYGGRAELGLIGDDDLRLKVSADGAGWNDAMAVDRSDGRVWFARGAGRSETTDLLSGGTYVLPAWARLVEIVCVGGGGGGGAGAVGAAETVRHGGGGGGAGGVSTVLWSTMDLGGTLTITVGAAGTGGAGAAGGAGGDSTVTTDGAVVLTGAGGSGGAVGGAASGPGGAGGPGIPAANGGGDSSVMEAGRPGETLTRPDGSGGGGGGGGLDEANTARSGGAGGAGASLRALANGGAGGTGAGGSGGWTSPKPALSWAGGGGGGGGASASGSGHGGGAGAAYGAGGGGGGAGSGGWGGGGAGAPGLVRITAIG